MADLPSNETNDGTVVTEGYFEREVLLSRDETATFLRELADQIDAGTELTVSSDEWEIPFQYGEPIEVEVEFVGEREKELEIELEFEWAADGGTLNIE
ncbi:amphi-Trp domain-containing protein [Halobacteriales archaeon QS_1_68_17]|jgi:amphi-Trp domain-containing protein|nr:MAG: amphi-Trp domain-containing protein [Halobacteriales archaeon QS_1_68_17]